MQIAKIHHDYIIINIINKLIYLFICYNSQRFPITVNVHVKD